MSSNCTACCKTILFILTRTRLFLFKDVAMENIKCMRGKRGTEGGYIENTVLHKGKKQKVWLLCVFTTLGLGAIVLQGRVLMPLIYL